jgi:group I intron endonuclease
MDTGVYVIEHIASGKKYVGSAAKSFSQRWGNHRRTLRKGTHKNAHLQSAWSKYGEDAFVFRIVKRTSPEDAVDSEQAHIDLYQACDPTMGYNNAPIAGSNLGYKHTDEARANMSLAQKVWKRNPHSSETIANMSAAKMGKKRKPFTAEARANMSIVKMGNKHNLGRTLTAEHRANLSAATKGRPKTAETRERMSAAQKLRPPASSECRAKMSEAAKRRCAAKREEAECTAEA